MSCKRSTVNKTYKVPYKKEGSCLKVPVQRSFPPSFISLCCHKSIEMNTLEQASTLPLKDLDPYHLRILVNLDGILVHQELRAHLLRVPTYSQPKKSMTQSKVCLPTVSNT